MVSIAKTIGFKDVTQGETIMQCIEDYPTVLSSTTYKDHITVDDSSSPKAGIWFKTYCDGGETLAFLGKLTAATGIAYMSLY